MRPALKVYTREDSPEAGIMRRFDAEAEEKAVLMRMVQEHGLGIHKTSEWFKAHLNHLEMVNRSFGVDYSQEDHLTFALARALKFGNRTYPGRLPLDSKWRDNHWIYAEKSLPSKPLDRIVDSHNFSNLDLEAQFGEPGIGRRVRRLCNFLLAMVFDETSPSDLRNLQGKLIPALHQSMAEHFTVEWTKISSLVDSTRADVAGVVTPIVDMATISVLDRFYRHFDGLQQLIADVDRQIAKTLSHHDDMVEAEEEGENRIPYHSAFIESGRELVKILEKLYRLIKEAPFLPN